MVPPTIAPAGSATIFPARLAISRPEAAPLGASFAPSDVSPERWVDRFSVALEERGEGGAEVALRAGCACEGSPCPPGDECVMMSISWLIIENNDLIRRQIAAQAHTPIHTAPVIPVFLMKGIK